MAESTVEDPPCSAGRNIGGRDGRACQQRVGDVVRIRWDLVNISGKDLAIPVDKNDPSQKPSVGVIQRWVEKLDGDPTIPVMSPKTKRSGRKYAAGGSRSLAVRQDAKKTKSDS